MAYDSWSLVGAACARIEDAPATLFAQSLPRAALLESGGRALGALDDDMARLHDDLNTLFAAGNLYTSGHELARVFTAWRKNPPSTTALVIAAAEHFGVPEESPALQTAIMAGMAADVTLDNPYHNNSHFREVTAMMARLCHVNNTLVAHGDEKATPLEAEDIALLLATAAAHDLRHDGKSNAPNGPGSHQQYLLEKRAIAALEPFMSLAGLPEAARDRARVMILITDATAPEGGKTPHKILRQIIAQAADEKSADDVTVPPELLPLVKDKKLRGMAALMSDADLGPSAATDYPFSKEQSRVLSKELPHVTDTPQGTIGFLDFVMDNDFASAAGQSAARFAMAEIYRKAASLIHSAPASQPRRAASAKKGPLP